MPVISSFEDARRTLNQFIPSLDEVKKKYTLERMQTLMEKLGNPQDTYKVIHIAGTSGKTSTAYYVAALLGQAGSKVGLTVSPHVDEVNERVQINLTPLPEADFCRELTDFLMILEQTGIKPTYFELLIAFAYWEFARQKVDYAVVEVGLGGLLDGTNVVSGTDKVCIITDIGIDHSSLLGDSVETIAAQKAGIIQPNNVVFMYQQNPAVMAAVYEAVTRQQAKLQEMPPPQDNELTAHLPAFQKRNWQLAKATVDYILRRDSLPSLSEAQLGQSTETYIPARMEIKERLGKIIVIDGSHNAQKVQALTESLRARFPDARFAVLLGLLDEKEEQLKGVMDEIIPLASHITVTSFTPGQDIPKQPMPLQKITDYCNDQGFTAVVAISDPKEAFQKVIARPDGFILITGSFYLLNHVRPLLFGSV